MGQRCPWQHEIDGREAHVKIVVEVGEAGIEFRSDFSALEGARGGIDCYLGHGAGNVESTFGASECGRAGNEILDLLGDQGHVGFEGV